MSWLHRRQTLPTTIAKGIAAGLAGT